MDFNIFAQNMGNVHLPIFLCLLWAFKWNREGILLLIMWNYITSLVQEWKTLVWEKSLINIELDFIYVNLWKSSIFKNILQCTTSNVGNLTCHLQNDLICATMVHLLLPKKPLFFGNPILVLATNFWEEIEM